jgi:predicted site-specific integrase-resolvase
MTRPDTVLITPAEVATILGVDPKTVGRWAVARPVPKISSIKTPGGHRRYYLDEVLAIRDSGRKSD